MGNYSREKTFKLIKQKNNQERQRSFGNGQREKNNAAGSGSDPDARKNY